MMQLSSKKMGVIILAKWVESSGEKMRVLYKKCKSVYENYEHCQCMVKKQQWNDVMILLNVVTSAYSFFWSWCWYWLVVQAPP